MLQLPQFWSCVEGHLAGRGSGSMRPKAYDNVVSSRRCVRSDDTGIVGSIRDRHSAPRGLSERTYMPRAKPGSCRLLKPRGSGAH
jgi:hypothetical protein